MQEDSGYPDDAARTITDGKQLFPENTDLPWQEVKLRSFLRPDDGRCWSKSRDSGGLWTKESAWHIPVDCCFLPNDSVPPAVQVVKTSTSAVWRGMRVAVLYRGHATRDMKSTLERSKPGITASLNSSADYTFDYRDIWAEHTDNILEPLKASGASVDVYASLHSSLLNSQVVDDLQPKKWNFETDPSSMQGAQVENGLNLIDRSEYDLIVVLRLDMLFKVVITSSILFELIECEQLIDQLIDCDLIHRFIH